jgi:hypothetical protein
MTFTVTQLSEDGIGPESRSVDQNKVMAAAIENLLSRIGK